MASLLKALGMGARPVGSKDPQMEEAIQEAAAAWGNVTGWSIHPHALSALAGYLGDEPACVIECGSGYSTGVLHRWARRRTAPCTVTSYEHDAIQIERLRGILDSEAAIRVIQSGLGQLTEHRFRELLASPRTAVQGWKQWADPLPEDLYSTTRVSRVFYSELAMNPPALPAGETLVVILDGPHGNGRSVAFPVLAGSSPDQSIWLIDDYDHYAFVEEMSQVYTLSDQQTRHEGDKRWTIVRATPRA